MQIPVSAVAKPGRRRAGWRLAEAARRPPTRDDMPMMTRPPTPANTSKSAVRFGSEPGAASTVQTGQAVRRRSKRQAEPEPSWAAGELAKPPAKRRHA